MPFPGKTRIVSIYHKINTFGKMLDEHPSVFFKYYFGVGKAPTSTTSSPTIKSASTSSASSTTPITPKPNPPMPDPRISPYLREFRDFLANREIINPNRFKDLIAPRSIPKPKLPEGPHTRFAAQYYYERDARRQVEQPTVTFATKQTPTPSKPGASGPAQSSSSTSASSSSAGLPTPGVPFRWD